jgi:hypothetical protein
LQIREGPEIKQVIRKPVKLFHGQSADLLLLFLGHAAADSYKQP